MSKVLQRDVYEDGWEFVRPPKSRPAAAMADSKIWTSEARGKVGSSSLDPDAGEGAAPLAHTRPNLPLDLSELPARSPTWARTTPGASQLDDPDPSSICCCRATRRPRQSRRGRLREIMSFRDEIEDRLTPTLRRDLERQLSGSTRRRAGAHLRLNPTRVTSPSAWRRTVPTASSKSSVETCPCKPGPGPVPGRGRRRRPGGSTVR
jgi:hypothetical protein